MTSALKDKILERMGAKNLSIAELERLAGLSIHSVRNIVKGRIKRPSAQSLQAIAEALDCSIVDLVDGNTSNDTGHIYRKQTTSPPLTHHTLMIDCCKVVLEIANEYERPLSIDEYLDVVKKIYTYSSKEDPVQLDMRFSQWLVETQLNCARKTEAS